MYKILLPVCIFLCFSFALAAVQASHEAETIASAIASEIQTGQPVFLDIRCGDWTPSVTQHLTNSLLNKNIDVRTELSSDYTQTPDTQELESSIKLSDYGLSSALLVQVNLNIKWEDVVQRKFFSYNSERRPVYSFETRQILLPAMQISKISTYDFSRPNASDSQDSRLRFRWFEPLVASAAIASMIFLLWNFD